MEYTDLGQVVPGTTDLLVTQYRDGYLYLIADSNDYSAVVKYNINTNQIEKTADITALKGTTAYCVNFLGDDLIIVGGNRQKGIIALNPETFEFVDTGLPGDGGGVERGAVPLQDSGSRACLHVLGRQVVLGGEQELRVPRVGLVGPVVEHPVLRVHGLEALQD